MANYLVAKCGNTTSSYSLRDTAPSGPYLCISNSYLPLTTDTKTGIQVKVNNKTYNIQESYSTSISSHRTATCTSYWQRSTSNTNYQTVTVIHVFTQRLTVGTYSTSYVSTVVRTLTRIGYTTYDKTSYYLQIVSRIKQCKVYPLYAYTTIDFNNVNYFETTVSDYLYNVSATYNGATTRTQAYYTGNVTLNFRVTNYIFTGNSSTSNNTYSNPVTYTKTDTYSVSTTSQ